MRPAPPPTGNGISRHSQGGPGSKDPGRINYQNVTIRSLIMRAYNLKDYQVTGPDWISSEGYDITATLSPDSTKEQFAGMMRRLLAERFHLVSHRDTKVMPVYAMIVGKTGLKLKAVEEGAPGAGNQSMQSGSAGTRIWGKFRLDQLAASITFTVGRPVLDMTELKELYDIDISWVSEESESAQTKGVAAGGGAAAIRAPEKSLAPDGNAAGSVFAALQDKCGLKLEARKSPIEILVVDQVDKVPTEN